MTRFSLSHRGVTVAVLAVITIGFMSQLPSLSTETGYRAYLGEDHPTIETLESFIEGFGGGLPMAAVWSCRDTDQCESVFDPRSLEMANAVVQELRNRGDIVRIESPATTPILIANGDEIGARTLLGATDIDALAARAVIDPLWRGTLVSTNGEAGAIFLELASSSSEDSKAVLRALEAALAPFEAAGCECRGGEGTPHPRQRHTVGGRGIPHPRRWHHAEQEGGETLRSRSATENGGGGRG